MAKAEDKVLREGFDHKHFSKIRGAMVSLLQNYVPIPVESVTFLQDSKFKKYTDLPSQYTLDEEGSELPENHQSI